MLIISAITQFEDRNAQQDSVEYVDTTLRGPLQKLPISMMFHKIKQVNDMLLSCLFTSF